VLCVVLFLAMPLYRGVIEFLSSLHTPLINPSIAAIEGGRCDNIPTIVLGDPGYINLVPGYAYRNDPEIIVPDYHVNVQETISRGVINKNCFILQEQKWHSSYRGVAYEVLSTIPSYTGKKYSTTPGPHVPDHAWSFVPK